MSVCVSVCVCHILCDVYTVYVRAHCICMCYGGHNSPNIRGHALISYAAVFVAACQRTCTTAAPSDLSTAMCAHFN